MIGAAIFDAGNKAANILALNNVKSACDASARYLSDDVACQWRSGRPALIALTLSALSQSAE